MLILLSIIHYLGNIYPCCSSLLKTNMLIDINAVITTFYSVCMGYGGKISWSIHFKTENECFPFILESTEGAVKLCGYLKSREILLLQLNFL